MGLIWEERKSEEPSKVLKAFIGEMHQWQQMCKDLSKKVDKGQLSWEELNGKAWEELKRIFSEYIQYKKLPENLVFSQSYFPEAEEIVEVTKDKDRVVIVTDRKKFPPPKRLKYFLTKVKGSYKVEDKVEKYDEFKKKFVPWDLLL